MMLRWAVGVAFALMAGAHVVRSAAALSEPGAHGIAAAIASPHPSLLKSRIMLEVAQAAIRGEDPPAGTLNRLERLAKEQPLAPEPYLVLGAVALRHGDNDRAEELLLRAQRLAPRSPAARYLLADFYLRTGRTLPAMKEMSVLNRLLPSAAVQLAPALAAFADTPEAAPQLLAIVEAYPEVKPTLLYELAADPRHVELILAIAGGAPAGPRAGDWQRRLLRTLIERGDYGRAHRIWERLSGVDADPATLFNPGFSASDAPPPFNWQLAQHGGGVAEGRSGGLQVLYYGRENVVLARQVLLLPPGRYELGMTVAGNAGEPRSVSWTVHCLGGDRQLLNLPLTTEGSGSRTLSGRFTVPESCEAQQLELKAVGAEFPKEADFRIGELKLARVGGQ